ncbi:MAG: GNAT family N-acetyltransferase [Phycisphaerae bacterium]|nr:GNAT family N-acetyltransferase [Phycisphaerae bacterium]
MTIRRADARDADLLWRILEPTIRAGETWALPRDWSKADALAYWNAPAHEVHVAEIGGEVRGTYFLRPAQLGPGDHVGNAGYMVRPDSWGLGLASAMCRHSIRRAAERGFRAVQFNFVVSTNVRAVELWQRLGFAIIGRSPGAYRHPTLGAVDALMMHRPITDADRTLGE